MGVVTWDSELSRVRGVSGCICYLYAIAIPVTRRLRPRRDMM